MSTSVACIWQGCFTGLFPVMYAWFHNHRRVSDPPVRARWLSSHMSFRCGKENRLITGMTVAVTIWWYSRLLKDLLTVIALFHAGSLSLSLQTKSPVCKTCYTTQARSDQESFNASFSPKSNLCLTLSTNSSKDSPWQIVFCIIYREHLWHSTFEG